MKYDQGVACTKEVKGLSDSAVSEIQEKAGIGKLSIILAIGVDSEDDSADKLVPLVPQNLVDDVIPVNLPEQPIETSRILDIENITVIKIEGSCWRVLHPLGFKVPCNL
jgi:hypothetical protein